MLFIRNFLIEMGIFNNYQPLISGTDIFYYIKKGSLKILINCIAFFIICKLIK